MKKELLELLCKINIEINDLKEHGDIPYDSYKDINEWLSSMNGIISTIGDD
jgi:hypothetical protein